MSPELWAWLLNLGWRKAMYKYDRRRYAEIPVQWAVELNRAPAEQWDKMLSCRNSGGARSRATPAVPIPGRGLERS